MRKAQTSSGSRQGSKKPTCADCFFGSRGLCALGLDEPCPTFRPAHPDGLRPPRQLSFTFRQPRRPHLVVLEPADHVVPEQEECAADAFAGATSG